LTFSAFFVLELAGRVTASETVPEEHEPEVKPVTPAVADEKVQLVALLTVALTVTAAS